MNPWDHPATPVYYEAFYDAHPRYLKANRALIAHAALEPGHRVLDVGAGTGRTAEEALACLGPEGRVDALEPSHAMRRAGRRRLSDPRLRWLSRMPGASARFDRILCGASIWQLEPFAEQVIALAARLLPGGALVFNIPALYLLEPDQPGGGRDPLLLELPARLFEDAPPRLSGGTQPVAALSAKAIEMHLRAAGLRPRSWSFRRKFTQDAYAAWLRIPVLTENLLPGLTPIERARRIDDALAKVDRASWKWERWRGWTAWKR
ncbi:MAG: class I SAM-dependent methyltransferase [Bryobacteraceae bacterium]